MNPPRRVIVRLPNWLGDTVMAVPALRAIRAGWPAASIMIAGPWAAMLAGQGLADMLVTYPRAWRGRLATADTIRAFRGEIAIVLPNSLESAVMARYAGARRRVGFAAGGRSWLLTDRVASPERREHQVDEYLRLVEHLGVPVATRTPVLDAPSDDDPRRAGARRLLHDAVGDARGPRVGIHLGAEYGPAKLWPVPRIVEGCLMLRESGMTPVLLGAPRERAGAAEVSAAASVASLVGKDEPALLPALLSELHGLVAGDTGVAHLAAALGTPVVTLFGPTDPRLTAPRGPATALVHSVPCAPCFYRRCPIDHPCLNGIDGQTVTAAVVQSVGEVRG
jgi:heptosyltransferase II